MSRDDDYDDEDDAEVIEEFEPEPDGKKFKVTRKHVIVVTVIAVVVLIILASGWLIMSLGGDVQDVNVIEQTTGPNGRELSNEIYYLIFVGSSGIRDYEGSVDVKITQTDTGSLVYDTALDIKDREAELLLSYDQFCAGNGEYTIRAEVGGKTATDPFNIDSIVGNINVTTYLSNSDHNQGNITIVLEDKVPGTYIKNALPSPFSYAIDVKLEGVSVHTITGQETATDLKKDNLPMQINETFPKTDRGNYTVDVTFTNDMVKDGLAARTILAAATAFLNAPPRANAGSDITENIGILDTTAVVEFDATGSYDPDGIITTYVWDFGDGTSTNPSTYGESIFDASDGIDNDNDGTIDEPGEAEDGAFDGKTEYTYIVASSREFNVQLMVFDDTINQNGETVIGQGKIDGLVVTVNKGF